MVVLVVNQGQPFQMRAQRARKLEDHVSENRTQSKGSRQHSYTDCECILGNLYLSADSTRKVNASSKAELELKRQRHLPPPKDEAEGGIDTSGR